MQYIRKRSLGQKAKELIRKMVLDGRFNEGERIVEDRIAAELGISRTPLREALHRLAQEGLLEKRRTGGYMLRTLDPREIEDAMAIRSMLESFAAALAAERATDEQKQALQKNLQMFMKAQNTKDIESLVELNEDFHVILRESANSPLLLQLLSGLDGVIERLLRPIISDQEVEWSETDHSKVFSCIEKGDAQGANHAMQEHIARARKCLDSAIHKSIN